MEILNRIPNGIHIDHNEYDQPDDTMRDCRNGVIYDTENGNYIWRNLKGTTQVLALAANEYLLRGTWIRNRYFIMILNIVGDYVNITELTFDEDGSILTDTVVWQSTNTIMTMSLSHPVRAMFGVYESETVQRIYFSDFYNYPRVINVAGTPPLIINEKFIDLVPEIDNVYGNFRFVQELSGGTLKAGTYFFAWRLYKDGYYTDWSYLSNPVPVFNGSPGSTYKDYQDIEGQNPDLVTTKGIEIELTDVDTDYDKIQIAAFYSNDLNSVGPGTIIYEGDIAGATISFSYYGGENNGTVTLAELMNTSLLITKCKDMVLADKYNVITDIEERAELDVSSVHSLGKNNQMEVSIIPSQYSILLDTRDYGVAFDVNSIPLYGTLTAAQEVAIHGVLGTLYHYAVTDVVYTDLDHLGGTTAPAGTYFKPTILASYTSGTAKLAIVKKKYRLASAAAPYDLNTDYVLDTTFVENDYYNYKNPLFSESLKGYPSGEKIRLGVLFFDKTGRPFFVRHLYNTETVLDGCTIGPGDTRIPNRYENDTFPISQVEGLEAGPPQFYKRTYGQVNYLTVSGLDITSVKDQIGAFAIVRCPIERENIAYGAVKFLYEGVANPNNIYSGISWRAFDHDTNRHEGSYAFYSPEDIFDLSGFSIQPGDKLVNRYYMTPFDPTEENFTGSIGFGTAMVSNGNQRSLYQKFYIWKNDVQAGNSARGSEHEILFYTKYKQGDGDDISFDPRDETKLFSDYTEDTFNGDLYAGYNTNLGIAVLDIDESGNDTKVIFDLDTDDPVMAVCSIKRSIASPYGGTGDSGLASSTYLSTGHFQIVDAGVLADIEDSGDYIFNEIDIFGGDTFICIWDLARIMMNEDDPVSRRIGHTFLMPIETRINLDLREGNHVGKLRTYKAVSLPDGLRWDTGNNKWEEFNYNDGYSSDNVNDLYLPVPANFTLQNKFDTDIRYSDPKSYGEYEDSFRKFRALNKYTLDTKFGSVTNIRYKFRNLIYWQKECVGYIPMGERALTSNDVGNVIQLGVSGIFERNDQIVEFVGNSNQFGLIESSEGFHWYDAIKKLFIVLAGNMQISPDSILKGMDRFFLNILPGNMDDYDNPGYTYGINGGFDPKDKIVYVTFRTASMLETIGISIKTGKFIGYFDYTPRVYFQFRNHLYASGDTSNDIHQIAVGAIGSYFGVSEDRYFSIIVKNQNAVDSVFDTFNIIGNDKFFSVKAIIAL